MKKLGLLVPACVFVLWIASCQKEIPDILNVIDTTTTANTFNDSFRIVQSRYEWGSEVRITNIEYDTVGRKINLYNDDTTTTNPYDELEQQYTYSSDGYLLSFETFQTANSDASKVIFERDASKRLTRVLRSMPSGPDTILFKYQTSGANTIVYEIKSDSDIVKTQQWVTYNSNNQYTNVINLSSDASTGDVGNKSVLAYTYNADGSLQQEKGSDTGFYSPLYTHNHTLTFSNYEPNTPPVFSNMTKVFLGRDWYSYTLQDAAHPFFMVLANASVQPDVSKHYEVPLLYGLTKPVKSVQLSYTQPFVQQDTWLWKNTKDNKGRITQIEQQINNVVIERWKLKYAL